MDMGERKRQILHSVINEYIASAEPVGSRHIAKNLDLGLSSATIRNEMADLEEMGYLEQPHTSAGRVPSDKGYRFYVNELMSDYQLSLKEMNMMKTMMQFQIGQLDKVMKTAADFLSQFTHYTAFMTSPEMKQGAIKTIELVPLDSSSMLIILVTNEGVMRNKRVMIPIGVTPEFVHRFSNLLKEKLAGYTLEEINVVKIQEIKEAMQSHFDMLFPVLDFISEIIDDVRKECDVYVSGTTNIFNYPEYSDIGKAREFLEFLDDKQSVTKALSEMNVADDEADKDSKGKVRITIGKENGLNVMQSSSVVTANYYVGDRVMGKVGIIGPKRMDYSKAVAKIERISHYLNRILSELYYDDNKE